MLLVTVWFALASGKNCYLAIAFKKIFYLLIHERQREAEGQADSPWSREHE